MALLKLVTDRTVPVTFRSRQTLGYANRCVYNDDRLDALTRERLDRALLEQVMVHSKPFPDRAERETPIQVLMDRDLADELDRALGSQTAWIYADDEPGQVLRTAGRPAPRAEVGVTLRLA